MSTSADTIRIALLALLAGAALPVLIQLFVTLRGLRRTADAVERRLDQTLRDIGDLAADVRRTAVAPTSMGAVIAAATPAVVAAVRAFRTSLHDHDGEDEGHAPRHAGNHENDKESEMRP
jgi:hypothetical protein